MTREDYNAVSASLDPLRFPLALPLRPSTFWRNFTLLAGDSIQSTQDALANEYASMARMSDSPLVVPEYTQGAITQTLA